MFQGDRLLPKVTSFIFALLCAIGALGLAVSPAGATPVLNVVGGQLVGASNVEVLGTLYDVSFVEGSCIALFSGCDNAAEDFDFPTLSSAQAAAQALLDGVIVGVFDETPNKTYGCSYPYCFIYIPFSLRGFDVIPVAVVNHPLGSSGTDGSSTSQSIPIDVTTEDVPDTVYARFTLAATAIPEPSTLLLFGFGLAGLAGFARRRKV
jgi:hypothetical protein